MSDTAAHRRPIIVHGATKVDVDGEVDDFWMLLSDGSIRATGAGATWRARAERPDARIIDVHGGIVTPGFIDLHCHGGGGASFADGGEALEAALAVHRAHGTTRTMLSLVSREMATLTEELSRLASAVRNDPLLLGIHLEGPFLAPARRGAHASSALRLPDEQVVDRLLAAGRGAVRMVTLAPELAGADAVIERLVAADVVVAVGHTEADFEATRHAIGRGARVLTHAFNAMAGIGPRAPGPVTAAALEPGVVIELILDGVHVHPAVAAALFHMAPRAIALITDAMAGAGCGDGEFRLGDVPVAVEGGVAVLSSDGTLAGSTLTLDRALRAAIAAGVPLCEAVRALTETPARAIGQSHRLGRLTEGFAADAVVFDEHWAVRHVIADGRRVGAP